MKFSAYMHEWLFENYYKNGVNIGKNGDFYTSVSLGSLFGIIISNYIISKYNKNKKLNIVEIGANEGHLMSDVIQGIFTLKPEILNYLEFNIIEPFDALRERQNELFWENFKDEIKVKHIDFNANLENAFVFSNEIFDSFICDIVNYDEILEVENHKFHFKKNKHNANFKGEKPYLDDFIMKLKNLAKNLTFITFDYGYTEKIDKFSLRIYKNHQVFNPFELENLEDFFGISDITYDVDFTNLRLNFENHGFKVTKFQSQARALMDFGAMEILKLIDEKMDFSSYQRANLQLKHLLYGFGSKFKMLEVTK